jgi:hypothetical protein
MAAQRRHGREAYCGAALLSSAGNSLWFESGPAPSTDIAPTFTASRIGGPRSAYGG